MTALANLRRSVTSPRTAIPVALALAASVLFALTGEMFIRQMAKQRDEALSARVLVGADVVHQHVQRRMEMIDVLHNVAQSWLILRRSGNEEGQRAVEGDLASSALAGRFGITQVAIIGADGWMIWSSVQGSLAPVYLGDREHFRVHADGSETLFVSRPVLGRVSRRWTLQLTRPLKEADGHFGGVAVVSLDLLGLSETLREVHFNVPDRALLIDRGGTYAARSEDPESFIGQRLRDNDPLLALPYGRTSGVVSRPGPDGRATRTGWWTIPGTDLVAAYLIETDAEISDFAQIRWIVWLTVLAFTSAAFAMAFLLVVLELRRAARNEAERTAAEHALAIGAHETFARRIAGLPAIVYGGTLSPTGRFDLLHMSESVERVVGWTPDQLRGRRAWLDLMDPAEVPRRADFFDSVAATGTASQDYRLRRPDGSYMWLRDSARSIGSLPDGRIELVGYIADITAEREMEARAQASGRLATLGEMATGLAHELNQPLAVMSLAAENGLRALARGAANAEGGLRQRLERIAEQAQRARYVVDHLRIFGRRDEGDAEPVDLAQALEGASVLAGGALRTAGIGLRLAVQDNLPKVMARLVPLEQALVNLLLNARDAIEARSPAPDTPWIEISSGHDATSAWLEVADNGGGIPPEIIDRLFEPFFTTKPPGKGTGLGLSICHATMRSFGGSITAHNTKVGAVFILRFKVAQQAVAPQPRQVVEAHG